MSGAGGDWEVDTVFKQGSGAVSLLERKSRLTWFNTFPANSQRGGGHHYQHAETLPGITSIPSQLTMAASLSNMNVAAELEAQVYFAHPYSAWERGQNENSNGLLRQYVPKGKIWVVTAEWHCQPSKKRLNFRPRKCLGFKQPQVVLTNFWKQPDFNRELHFEVEFAVPLFVLWYIEIMYASYRILQRSHILYLVEKVRLLFFCY